MPDSDRNSYYAIVIGGGAAGLMCAIEAGKRGCLRGLLEHAERCGKKILISGGGRCNFTNIYTQPENFLLAIRTTSQSPRSHATPRLISSHSWKSTASATTKRN